MSSATPHTPERLIPERRGPHRAFLVLALALIVLGFLYRGKLLYALLYLEIWVGEAGPLAPILLGVICAIWFVLCLPGPPILGVVGTVFADEPWIAMGVAMFADVTATVVGFQTARHFARERVRNWLSGKPWFDWLETQVASKGLYGVFVMRMMPFFPNLFANYALGLIPLRFWPYLGASFLGSLPNNALYVFGTAGAVSLIRDGFANQLSLREAMIILVCLGVLVRLLQKVSKRLNQAKSETFVK